MGGLRIRLKGLDELNGGEKLFSKKRMIGFGVTRGWLLLIYYERLSNIFHEL